MNSNMASFIIRLLRSGPALFIWTILSSWYFYIASAALMAAYYALKGLKDSGLLDQIQTFIFGHIRELVYISQTCFPLIANLRDFLNCIANN